jgi:hypothetical protein
MFRDVISRKMIGMEYVYLILLFQKQKGKYIIRCGLDSPGSGYNLLTGLQNDMKHCMPQNNEE